MRFRPYLVGMRTHFFDAQSSASRSSGHKSVPISSKERHLGMQDAGYARRSFVTDSYAFNNGMKEVI